MDFSIIIPVFNGKYTIEKLFEGINNNLKNIGQFEVIFVYDQGSDNSWEILKNMKEKYPEKIRIFKLKKNYGQHNAILLGISESYGNLIITMDEDLQHDPDSIGALIKKQKEKNFDVIYGKFIDSKHSFLRGIASNILQIFLKILIPGLGYYSSFRLIKKDVARSIVSIKSSYTFIDARLKIITSNFGFVKIDHRENTTRVSTYNFITLFSHAIRIILAYSRVVNWIIIGSLLMIFTAWLFAFFNFTNTGTRTVFLVAGLVLLFLGLSGFLFNKWKLRTNTLPVVVSE